MGKRSTSSDILLSHKTRLTLNELVFGRVSTVLNPDLMCAYALVLEMQHVCTQTFDPIPKSNSSLEIQI